VRKVRSSCSLVILSRLSCGCCSAALLLGGIIDQDINPPERTHGVLHGLLAEAFIAHIAGNRHTTPALLLHTGLRLMRVVVLVQVYDGHIGPFFGEGDGHGAADATVSSGDERNLALQFATASVVSILGLRPRRHVGLDARLPILVLRWLLRLGVRLFLCHIPPSHRDQPRKKPPDMPMERTVVTQCPAVKRAGAPGGRVHQIRQ
jgi:hypothetical protein